VDTHIHTHTHTNRMFYEQIPKTTPKIQVLNSKAYRGMGSVQISIYRYLNDASFPVREGQANHSPGPKRQAVYTFPSRWTACLLSSQKRAMSQRQAILEHNTKALKAQTFHTYMYGHRIKGADHQKRVAEDLHYSTRAGQ
jgi:hypothetical protein